MQFHRIGTTLVMSGPVGASDLARLKDALAAGELHLVVLHQSDGGDLWNAQQLAWRIRFEGLDTAVSGQCESACALVFLGGVHRWFSDGMPLASTMVGLHGAHEVTTWQPMPEFGARMKYEIDVMTGGRFPRELLDRTVYSNDPADMTFAFHPLRFGDRSTPKGVMRCLKQPMGSFDCRMIDGLDAIAIGVVTEPGILQLDESVKAWLAAP